MSFIHIINITLTQKCRKPRVLIEKTIISKHRKCNYNYSKVEPEKFSKWSWYRSDFFSWSNSQSSYNLYLCYAKYLNFRWRTSCLVTDVRTPSFSGYSISHYLFLFLHCQTCHFMIFPMPLFNFKIIKF